MNPRKYPSIYLSIQACIQIRTQECIQVNIVKYQSQWSKGKSIPVSAVRSMQVNTIKRVVFLCDYGSGSRISS